MKKILWTIFLFLVMSDNVLADEDYLSSVAQVRVTNYSYSIDHPWQKGSAGKTSGSAVLISGNRLLTNAHVVESAVRVELRRVGSDRWYPAFIEHVSEASDLAMLRAAEKDFYIDATPARLATDISPGASVLVVGFPQGGDNVSVTKGVLSRTEETVYSYSLLNHIAYQIDAAVNNGNSGGAVFSDGKLMGVSFQASAEAENVGYAIPVAVIEQFITDALDGVIHGVPQLPFLSVPVINTVMKEYLGLEQDNGTYVFEAVGDKASQCAAPGDVVTAVNGIDVNEAGRVVLPGVGRVSIDYFAASGQIGDSVQLDIVANGKKRRISCELTYSWGTLWGSSAVASQYRPSWIEVGGLILVDMTDEVFAYIDENEIDVHVQANTFRSGLQQGSADNPFGGIFVSNVLDHDANAGYEMQGLMLKLVNGESPASVAAVKDIVAANSSPWLVLEFYDGDLAVFKQSELGRVKDELAAEYGF